MNLFRSEEHIRNWPHFDASTEEGILPLDDLVHMFSMNFFKHRMDETYVTDSRNYVKEFFAAVAKIGEEKPFWAPR
jgi:hypothetical protein